MSVVGRLAPSPTGHLHLGHARSFLIAWWSARSQGGRIVLRIEDLDAERNRPELIDDCMRDLEWLGLDWDQGPRKQSEGVHEILAAAERLHALGLTYPCVCSRSDLKAAASAPQEGVEEWRYPGTCRGRFSSREQARAKGGKASAMRFSVNPGSVTVLDSLCGKHSFDIFTEVGDFPVLRRDGSPAYQLAVVVDDARDGVTEVIRGDDLLPSAARQQLLYQALGLEIPRWMHLPLVTDRDGRRLAKRADDVSLQRLRALGVDARAIVKWAAISIGCVFGGLLSPDQITALFRFEKIGRDRIGVSADSFAPASSRARQGMDP